MSPAALHSADLESSELTSAYRVPRWAEIVTLVLSLVGLGLSTYLTVAHYEGAQILVCTNAGIVNCTTVTTSAQSYFLGVPVAVLGLVAYGAMTALTTPWAWRSNQRWLQVTRFMLAIGAMAFVLWLVYAELIIINAICLYCTGVHVTTFLLLIILTIVSPAQLGWTRSRPR